MPRHSDINSPRPHTSSPWMRVALLAPALSLALAGCNVDKLLKVKAPDVVVPGSINNAAALPTLLAGTYGDFAFAWAGDGSGQQGFIQFSGQLSDELFNSETFPTRVNIDRRQTGANNADNLAAYQQMHIARADGERTAAAYIKFLPRGVLGEAQALNLVGFSYVLLGEDYCTGQPFSTVSLDGSTFVPGVPETTAQVFADAIARFDSALVVLANDTTSGDQGGIPTATNDALVGKARALLNLGRFDSAAALASAVPTAFADSINYSTNTVRQQDGVFESFQVENRVTVPDSEGVNGLGYRSAADPRIPWQPCTVTSCVGQGGTGFDGATLQFNQLIFPSHAAAIPFASGVEARLIQAEGAMFDGNTAGYLTNLQAARDFQKAAAEAVAPAVFPDTLGTITDPGTPAGRVTLLFRERAFDLWLTAHRLGDLRRMARSVASGGYGLAPATLFPIGPYPKGGNYGTDVALPVPIQEAGNNPNFQSCDTSVP